jgi:hypothetical protein
VLAHRTTGSTIGGALYETYLAVAEQKAVNRYTLCTVQWLLSIGVLIVSYWTGSAHQPCTSKSAKASIHRHLGVVPTAPTRTINISTARHSITHTLQALAMTDCVHAMTSCVGTA